MIETNGRSLMITATDIDLQGSISAAHSLMSLHGATTDQTIGLGVTQQMTLSDDELGRITALAGLSVGSSHTGDIAVGGITASNSDMFGTLRLMATKPSKSVKFQSAQSAFSQGILVLPQRGVHLQESVSTQGQPTMIVTGTAAFTLDAGKSLSTTNQALTITADDIELAANAALNSSSSPMVLVPFSDLRNIGVGQPAGDFNVEDSELGTITSAALTIGDSFSGDITAGAISNSAVADITVLTLKAMQQTKKIEFSSACDVQGLNVYASKDVALNGDLTATRDLVIHAGSGTFTLASSKTLSTAASLTVIADDIDIKTGSSVSSTGAAQVAPYSRNRTIGVGAGTGQFTLDKTELSVMSSAGLTIGQVDSSGSINVADVTNATSNGINGVLTLLTTIDDSQITFESTSSTFHSLDAVADNGCVFHGDVTTTAGALYIDGDEDNSATSDSLNTIWFDDGTAMTAKSMLTLKSTAMQAGALTLVGGSGVTISDVLTGLATGNV